MNNEPVRSGTLPGSGGPRTPLFRRSGGPVVKSNLGPQGLSLRRIAAIVGLAIILFWRDWLPLEILVGFTFLFSLIQVIFVPAVRLASLLVLSLTLYASTAFLAFKYGNQNFDPWPTFAIVESMTRLDITCVLLAVCMTEIVFGAENIDQSVNRASKAVQSRLAGIATPIPDIVLSLILLGVGVNDLLRIFSIGISNILADERRRYANELLLGSNHNIQVLCIAASVYLVVRIVLVKAGALPFVALVSVWAPFLLVGSRKEAITVATICMVVLSGKINRKAKILLGVGFVASLGLPALKTGNLFASLHEFILPQYMHFSIAMGLVPADLGGTFIERTQFMLPSFFRVSDVVDFGQAFFNLKITGVGIGASPFGEAALNNFFESVPASFVIVYCFLIALLVGTSQKAPMVTCVVFGLLVVYGRSDFWTLMFFSAYVSLLIVLFTRFPASKNAELRAPELRLS